MSGKEKLNLNNSSSRVIEVPKSNLEKLANDPVKSAKLFKLVYIANPQKGILRRKVGNGFRYFYNDKTIQDPETLERIRKLVIPPAWKNVWICRTENGHLQATGIDLRQRKQYRYHTLWNQMRSETKFFRLHDFGKKLPALRKRLQKDIALPGMHLNKILAAIVMLMKRTSIRIGSSFYEKLYGSFGLTTLKNRHVNVKGTNISFSFIGKKGIKHKISLRSKRLSRIVQNCLEIPGKELFQFYDDEGNVQPIDSGMVNDYIREITEAEFTSKDFRTWSGSIAALVASKEKGGFESESEMKHKTVEILDEVARHLGNSRTVCKKYYVHPLILELYENHQLEKYLEEIKNTNSNIDSSGYMEEEKVLMKILESKKNRTKVIEVVLD